jgi:hypothetical protein
MTVGEISNLLNLNRTLVEYNKITCAQKLSGQTIIGRKDVVSFFVRYKYHRSTFGKLIMRFRRERSWRNLEMRNRLTNQWRHNEGW